MSSSTVAAGLASMELAANFSSLLLLAGMLPSALVTDFCEFLREKVRCNGCANFCKKEFRSGDLMRMVSSLMGILFSLSPNCRLCST